jgi:predicted RNA-binding protein YlxR (DUF448 family)
MLDADILSDTDAGPRDRGAGPERLCGATRTIKPVGELIRFVVDPENTVVPDVKRKLPGRGVWVTATAAALMGAIARNAFAKGFKRPVRAPPDLVATTDRLLVRAALDALAIANKSGLVQAGFAKVETALARAEVAALLHAAEAAPDGVRKLAAAAKRAGQGIDELTLIGTFSSAQLDLALGRSNVVHAAVLAGPASEAFLVRYRSLDVFRGSEPANTVANPRDSAG